MKYYSKQREAILSALMSTTAHPTAAAVYEMVKKTIPNISLGTVYRNLAYLRDSGEILGFSVGDGNEHFDGDNSTHIHMHCKICGEITDLHNQVAIVNVLTKTVGFTAEKSLHIVDGICKKCNSENDPKPDENL